ncbi:hypothetical protein TeGR_g12005, partial [Tetraparma gracilis]
MDYTLAAYLPAFDLLAFDGAREKLVRTMGYPRKVLEFGYDPERWARGLIVDTARGNFIKVDKHKYVRVARHGHSSIPGDVRKMLYSRFENQVDSFSGSSYVNVDTLFQLVDASLYASLVRLKDGGGSDFLDGKTYEEMYADVRECVDLCHRDGAIKDFVKADPGKYVVADEGLRPMLEAFRAGGVKTFLLTNSLWDYTAAVMDFLCGQGWESLFDVVIAGSCKPAFLLDTRRDLFRIDAGGRLENCDGVYEIAALEPGGAGKFLAKGKVFQGGNYLHLNALLQMEAGEEILYVGDHL